MEPSEEKNEYLYSEPIKGDVYKYKVIARTDTALYLQDAKGSQIILENKVYPDGSYYIETRGSFFPETEEWKIKYQDSLYLRVCQNQLVVYFVQSIKRGKVNTRALVIGDDGACYHTYVPTFPTPRLGERYIKLRMDLEVVSLVPVKDLWEKVMEERRLDPSL